MKIEYTFHALEQMEERKIIAIWVEEALNYPDIIKREGFKYYAIKKLNGKTIKVVYIKEKSIKVITTFFLT
jgi:hypothetical protein